MAVTLEEMLDLLEGRRKPAKKAKGKRLKKEKPKKQKTGAKKTKSIAQKLLKTVKISSNKLAMTKKAIRDVAKFTGFGRYSASPESGGLDAALFAEGTGLMSRIREWEERTKKFQDGVYELSQAFPKDGTAYLKRDLIGFRYGDAPVNAAMTEYFTGILDYLIGQGYVDIEVRGVVPYYRWAGKQPVRKPASEIRADHSLNTLIGKDLIELSNWFLSAMKSVDVRPEIKKLDRDLFDYLRTARSAAYPSERAKKAGIKYAKELYDEARDQLNQAKAELNEPRDILGKLASWVQSLAEHTKAKDISSREIKLHLGHVRRHLKKVIGRKQFSLDKLSLASPPPLTLMGPPSDTAPSYSTKDFD